MALRIIVTSLLLSASLTTYADVLKLDVKVSNSQFLKGLNVSGDSTALGLRLDWSHNSGGFTGADCYTSNPARNRGWSDGCQFYAGYFMPLNLSKDSQQALTASVRRYEFSNAFARDPDFTEVVFDWHFNRNQSISLSASNDWLGRGFRSVAIDARMRRPISSNLNAIVGLGITDIESSAPVSSIEFAEIGLQYALDRWSFEAKALHGDSDLSVMTGFAVDQPDLLFSLGYQIY